MGFSFRRTDRVSPAGCRYEGKASAGGTSDRKRKRCCWKCLRPGLSAPTAAAGTTEKPSNTSSRACHLTAANLAAPSSSMPALEPRRRRCPNRARAFEALRRRACPSARYRWPTGISASRRRCWSPTCRSGRLDSSRCERARTGFPICDPPWAPSAWASASSDASCFSCGWLASMRKMMNLPAPRPSKKTAPRTRWPARTPMRPRGTRQ
jgi:hypothetical protein